MKHKKLLMQSSILVMTFCFILIGPIFGQSRVTKISEEECVKLMGEKTVERGIKTPIYFPFNIDYPPAIDWRNKDGQCYVTKPKNQQPLVCGSCTAFAAVSALESLVLIENNRPNTDIDLSEMSVFNCAGGVCLGAGVGLEYEKALSFLQTQGAPDETCWPYTPINQNCSNSCSNRQKRTITINQYGDIKGIEQCKTMVAKAPIMASMKLFLEFDNYKGGIIEDAEVSPYGGHAVCIVGYDHDPVVGDYWIVKNSYGEDWGENGFFRIKMGLAGIEDNAHWMANAVLPLVPAAPSNLTATLNSNPQVILNWNDNSDNESGYEIQRKMEGGVFSTIVKIGENSTSYSDNSVSNGNSYYYQVRDFNAAGYSAFSNIVTISTPTATLTVTSPNGGENWTAGSSRNITWGSTGTITNVKIDYSINSGKNWINIINSTPNDGINPWKIPIPNNPLKNCKVRISDAANLSVNDSSDSTFSIIASNPLFPDLKITNVTFSGYVNKSGGHFTFKIEISNIGDLIIPSGTLVKVKLTVNNSTSYSTSFSSGINVGGKVNCTIANVLVRVGGTSTIVIAADHDNQIVEKNENNNTYATEIEL